MKRRQFIEVSVAAATGLMLRGSLTVPLAHGAPQGTARDASDSSDVVMNAWLRIKPDNRVTIILSQAEMGQGVYTTLPAIIADELGADWSGVDIENSPVAPAYRNPRLNWQFTGNAESVRSFHALLRTMGANARDMLIAAAARRWRVQPASCATESSHVVHRSSRRRVPFAEVASAAARVPVPKQVKLKEPSEWTLVGRPLPRRDVPPKVTGTAVFGIDFEVPNMVHAAIKQPPVFGGSVTRLEPSSVTALPGVIDVVSLPNGVAVVAEPYWQARKALGALDVKFDDGGNGAVSTESLKQQYRATMDGDRWTEVVNEGDALELMNGAPPERRVTAEYASAWQAHATMEPINCTAQVSGDRCHIWGPIQGQEMVQIRVAAALELPPGNVSVERTFLGGGFGRRLIADYAVQAALISRKVQRPVKVLWSREEDMQHDHYRPRVEQRMSAVLGDDGLPVATVQKLVSPTILSAVLGSGHVFRYPQADPSCLEGLQHMVYDFGAQKLDMHVLDVPIPTMVWRTTGYGPNLFALEIFIDELAHAAGQDPIAYRRALLSRGKGDSRALAVLERVAREADWDGARAAGRHLGVAAAYAFDTYIAQVVDISLTSDGVLDIHRVISAVDCGRILDPVVGASSIEGGIVWGLTQCLSSEITFAGGRVEQSNFDDFRLLTLPETPDTQVHFIDSGAALGGLGEVGPIPVAPALCNAIFAATGTRYRTLPLSHHGIHTRYARQFVAP